MDNDLQPSVITACFTTPKAWRNLKQEFKQQNITFRELKLIDINIPLETKEYERTVNYLRRVTKPILKRFIDYIPFKNIIFKQLINHNIEPFDYDKYMINAKPDYKTPLAYAGLTPLFIDTKYKTSYSKEEQTNLEMLKSFTTRTFKPTPLKEQGIYEDKDMQFLKDKKEGTKLI